MMLHHDSAAAAGGDGAAADAPSRKRPNILVTGTPGCGKTTTCTLLAEATKLQHLDLGKLVKEKSLHDGWDKDYECYTIDEDKICDELEDTMSAGGNIVDFHTVDFFPERWFDLVLVLRTDNTVLYDRLSKRGYNQKKLGENIECEIMQVILEEAREAYAHEIVHECPSNTLPDMQSNVQRVQQWLEAWVAEHAEE